MSYEILVGLKVTDDLTYQAYRDAIAPILVKYEGRFCYDFSVDKVLRSEKSEDINRVFTLNFPSQVRQKSFFSDDAYLAVKTKYFEASVAQAHILAAFNKDD